MPYEEAQSVLESLAPAQAEEILEGLEQLFLNSGADRISESEAASNLEAQYRTLVEQIPAVVFMVYLDRGVGEAYVSPQIEAMLGFTRDEWLEDPVRWYERIHPDDKHRWSAEAAEMFLSGKPLRSVYRVIARDGHIVSFHCDARMVRRPDGRPWFIHGIGFDITDLKRAEEALQAQRNFANAVLDTVGALVVVADPSGHIVSFNRACERSSGLASAEVIGENVWDIFMTPEGAGRFRDLFERARDGRLNAAQESAWEIRRGEGRRVIAWTSTVLQGDRGAPEHVILTGIDVTEAKRLQRTILEISGREQRRIGQDLHDGLGQHLTGVAFMSKVLEQKLRDKALPETAEAAKIVGLVNEAIHKTRELSRGLLPVLSDARGLMNALERLALEVEDLFHISCRFECSHPVLVPESDVATHLYHIAQEAVNNALKHARPRHIVIRLADSDDGARLTVEDDGSGLDPSRPAQGMGMLIMSYRAKVIGGALEVRPISGGGTAVSCAFAGNSQEEAE